MALKFLGVDKWIKLFRMFKEHGGFGKSLYKIYRMDDLKPGKLIGEDKYGNKYFENNYYFYGRNRWLEFAPKYGVDYDGSQIPAEWFGWMHYKTDLPPHLDKSRPKYAWMPDHTENFTGTPLGYYPYSTTRPKIEPWIPKQKSAPANKCK